MMLHVGLRNGYYSILGRRLQDVEGEDQDMKGGDQEMEGEDQEMKGGDQEMEKRAEGRTRRRRKRNEKIAETIRRTKEEVSGPT